MRCHNNQQCQAVYPSESRVGSLLRRIPRDTVTAMRLLNVFCHETSFTEALRPSSTYRRRPHVHEASQGHIN